MITPTRIAALATAFFVIVTAPAFMGVLTATDGPIAKFDQIVNGTETTTTTTRLGPRPATPTRVRWQGSDNNDILVTGSGGQWLIDQDGPVDFYTPWPHPAISRFRTYEAVSFPMCTVCPRPATISDVRTISASGSTYVVFVRAFSGGRVPSFPSWVLGATSEVATQEHFDHGWAYGLSYTPVYDRQTISTTTTSYNGGMRGYWFHPLMAVLVDLMPIGIYLNVGFAILALWKIGSPSRSSSKTDSPMDFGSGTF